MVNSIEIYHAVHTQNETRAPIRTMLFEEMDGESTLLASYTCTPLVTIPVDKIENGADVKGKTIAELGYGNTPIDMLVVTTQGFDGSTSKSLIVTNKNRGGTMIPLNSVMAGINGGGMAGQQAMFASGLEGIQEIPTANVMQVDIQNPQMLGMVRRNIETGDIDLVSELTGTFLRLSDFISEYDFPDYKYSEAQAKKFAAAFPICGGANPAIAPTLKKPTWWVFHGDADKVVPEKCSSDIVTAMGQQKVEVKYTVYPGVGHNSWDNAFAEPDLMKWLFAQTR
ncbi:MAG: hypothetical protein AAFP96_04900, partial [Bacteroidota bacterium]